MYINNSKNFYYKSKKLTDFLSCSYDGIFYIGHASILVRLNNKKYLFDTIEQSNFYNNSWCFFPSQVMDKRFFDVDGVFVSHIHQDHYDPKFLKKVQKKNIPIYVLDGRKSFFKTLKKEKIKFTKIPNKKKYFIDDEIWIYGCLHEYNDIDSSMVISNNNLSIYHGNDNFITVKSLIPFKKIIGNIDVGCIPFAFIHYYPYLLSNVAKSSIKKEGYRLENQFMDYGITQAKILKPKIVIPFGSNLFHIDNPNSLMNKAVATPVDFVNYAKKKHFSMSRNYKTMLSESYCFKFNNKLSIYSENVSASVFNTELKKFIFKKKVYKKISKKTKPIKLTNKHLKIITNKLKNITKKINHKILIGNRMSENDKILINLFNNKVSIYKDKILPNNCHYFNLESNEYNMWLNKKITFEEVLGSRRFRYIRKPNLYNVSVMQIYTNYL